MLHANFYLRKATLIPQRQMCNLGTRISRTKSSNIERPSPLFKFWIWVVYGRKLNYGTTSSNYWSTSSPLKHTECNQYWLICNNITPCQKWKKKNWDTACPSRDLIYLLSWSRDILSVSFCGFASRSLIIFFGSWLLFKLHLLQNLKVLKGRECS